MRKPNLVSGSVLSTHRLTLAQSKCSGRLFVRCAVAGDTKSTLNRNPVRICSAASRDATMSSETANRFCNRMSVLLTDLLWSADLAVYDKSSGPFSSVIPNDDASTEAMIRNRQGTTRV